MKYRIVTAAPGFYTQLKYRYWPFWCDVFVPGHNYFRTVDEAEAAIMTVIRGSQTDGRVVKEFETVALPENPNAD